MLAQRDRIAWFLIKKRGGREIKGEKEGRRGEWKDKGIDLPRMRIDLNAFPVLRDRRKVEKSKREQEKDKEEEEELYLGWIPVARQTNEP